MEINDLLKKYSFLKKINSPFMPVYGREKEIDLLQESLLKKRMKNTILIGKSGSGKSAIIEHFAEINQNSFFLLEMNLSNTVSGTIYRGMLEEKINNAFEDIIEFNKNKRKKIILFIDEIHCITNFGSSEGCVCIAEIVKPFLSKLEITIIGATTKEDYEKTIKKDKSLIRRLSPIFIDDLNKEVIIQILNEFALGKISEKILNYIYDVSSKIEYATNPDISLEILDRCLARKKHTKKEINEKMIDEIVGYMNVN